MIFLYPRMLEYRQVLRDLDSRAFLVLGNFVNPLCLCYSRL